MTSVAYGVYDGDECVADVEASGTCDAWGNVQSAVGNGQSAVLNRFLFQGREYSFATGLYNFRARWYDPATGRCLSKDPIGLEGGLNLYAAFGNNPVNYRDPWGEDVVYLVDTGAVVGFGHAAAAVGSNAKGWTYYSFGSGGDRGEKVRRGAHDNYTVRHYRTLEELIKDNSRYHYCPVKNPGK